MGKSIFDYLAPIAGAALGSAILPGVGTSLGLSLGSAGGGAIGAGIGSGLATGVETGSPIAGLTSGITSGVGSYAGGKLLGPALEGLGGNVNPASGGTNPGFMGTPLAKSLGDAGLGSTQDVFGGSTPGSLVGSSIGSSVSKGMADSLSPGIFDAPQQPSSSVAGFSPSRQSSMNLPTSLSSYQNLDPMQQATNIASKGVYGGGQGPDEKNYFLNLINRQLVGDNGQVAGDTSSINPVENTFLSQLGLGGYKNPNDLLKGISQYS